MPAVAGQIVKSPPPAAEAEVKAQLTLLRMQANKLKQYPSLDAKQRDRDAAQSKVCVSVSLLCLAFTQRTAGGWPASKPPVPCVCCVLQEASTAADAAQVSTAADASGAVK
jgi:hypothetical protein